MGNGIEDRVHGAQEWLNISSLTLKDRGWYKCATNHVFGRDSSHALFINVQSKWDIGNWPRHCVFLDFRRYQLSDENTYLRI